MENLDQLMDIILNSKGIMINSINFSLKIEKRLFTEIVDIDFGDLEDDLDNYIGVIQNQVYNYYRKYYEHDEIFVSVVNKLNRGLIVYVQY